MSKPISDKKRNLIIKHYNAGLSKSQIALKVKVGRSTVTRYINRYLDDQAGITPECETASTVPPITDTQTIDPVYERDQEMRTLRHSIIAGITALLGLIWWIA